jgi:hypothetical protein
LLATIVMKHFILKLSLSLIVVGFGSVPAIRAADNLRANTVSCTKLLKTLLGLRSEIERASDAYKTKFPNAAASMLRGAESKTLPIVKNEDGHMLSLASGPDVYRPLYDFPFIKHFHLVDVMVGWGESPSQVIAEVIRRLEEFHPTAKVKILQRGFLDHIPENELKTPQRGQTAHTFLKKYLSPSIAKQPLIVSLKWNSPVWGRQSKVFYLHMADMNSTEQIATILNTIPKKEPLVGILEAGWSGFPDRPAFDLIMDRIDSAGFFIYEDMDVIGFNPQAATAASEEYLGPQYKGKLTIVLPSPDVQSQMAREDILGENRIQYEYLISKPIVQR